ncbi:uncharacterized protein LOC124153712 [Ischnura elegans]|uniref:uncharacterized protein LOC124153712 n=1 Tax=Ischnura elegans TaxID=197161 RepID=UPI001ED888B6|nr:uncharacterized protein LOC124153712 [Ischnura elegans]
MASSTKKSKGASERKGGAEATKQENLKFDHFPACIQEVTTAIDLISCKEEPIQLAALTSLDKFAAKAFTNVGRLLEYGVKPELLLSMAFEEGVLPPESPSRVFAAKLLTRFAKIPKVRDSLGEDGMEKCLQCLERNESEVLNEYSSHVLADLTIGTSVSYASALLNSPVTRNMFPLKVLFSRLSSSKDPDVVYNCLRNIWQLLIAASAAPDSRHFIDVLDDIEAMALLPPLFRSNYPPIQTLSLAVAYEAALRSSIAHNTLSSSFPALLELLETPSNSLLANVVLALIRRLVLPPAAESEEKNTKGDDHGLALVTIDGPRRLIELQKLFQREPGDVRFWSMAAILALYTSPSAADILIEKMEHHLGIPALIQDVDSNIADAAAYALYCIRDKTCVVESILQSSAPRDMAALAARLPFDEEVQPEHQQTLEGCAVVAALLKGLVRENLDARKALVEGPQEQQSRKESSTGKDSSSGSVKVNTPTKPSAIESLREILERVGKLPDDCITAVLSIISTVAFTEDLRSAVSRNKGLVKAVINCLEPPPYVPPNPSEVELPGTWPATTAALGEMIDSRLRKDRMWLPENPAPALCSPLPEVKESAISTLGILMLDNVAAEIFIANQGPTKIRKILENEDRRFGRNSLLEAALAFIIQCPSNVANDFVANGTLAWMLTEAALSRHIPFTAPWHDCIASLLRSNPSAKFQVTGRLNPEDSTGDLFYVVCPAPGKYEATPTITELMEAPPVPHRHVFTASFQTFATPRLRVAMSSAAGSSPRRKSRMSRESRNLSQVSQSTEQASLLQLFLEPDEHLMEMEATLRAELQHPAVSMRTMIDAIAKVVWEEMAGPVKDGTFKKERHLEELKVEFGHGDVIPLGMVRMGGYTERAILFKVLADRLGLPVALVRGAYGRCWIEVALVEVAEKEVEPCEVVLPEEPEVTASTPEEKQEEPERRKTRRSSRAREPMSGKGSASRERKKATQEKKDLETQEDSPLLPAENIPQELLHVPTWVVKPNHVVDLLSSETRLLPIGSYDADVYCGYSTYEPLCEFIPDRNVASDSSEKNADWMDLEERLEFCMTISPVEKDVRSSQVIESAKSVL